MKITRRVLLKQLSAGALATGAVTGTATVNALSIQDQTGDQLNNSLGESDGADKPDAQLEVTIIATNAVPYGTVLIKNRSTVTQVINNFTPGTISFDGFFVEMVQATGVSQANPLFLAPGEIRSFQIPTQQLSAVRNIDKEQYVEVGDSVEKLSGDTVIARVEGNVLSNRAVLSAPAARLLPA